jgi:Acyltransferase family
MAPDPDAPDRPVTAASAVAPASSRDDAYDWVKGFLVAAMVVYHAMNVVTTASEAAYGYVRFVSGSFIFVTGLLLSRHVSAGFDRDPMGTTGKLVLRGLKLVLLFTALNIAIQASGFGNAAKADRGVAGFLAQADAVYLRGDGTIASFVILLPIGYLLICAPLFLRAAGPTRPTASLVLLAVTLLAAGLPLGGLGSAVAEFMVIGVVGLCAGALLRPRAPSGAGWARALVGLSGLVASVWLTAQLYFNVALYTVCVALVIHFLYVGAQQIPADGPLGRWFVLLGRFSLFGYIAQIVLIQLAGRALGRPQWPLGWQAALFAVLIFAVLVGACVVVLHARQRFNGVDRAYRWVFA